MTRRLRASDVGLTALDVAVLFGALLVASAVRELVAGVRGLFARGRERMAAARRDPAGAHRGSAGHRAFTAS